MTAVATTSASAASPAWPALNSSDQSRVRAPASSSEALTRHTPPSWLTAPRMIMSARLSSPSADWLTAMPAMF